MKNSEYIRVHRRLRQFWLNNNRVFAEVSYKDQMVLHRFFRPSEEMAKEELLAYRDRVTAEDRGLPQRAGQALTRLWDGAAKLGMQQVARAKAPAGRVRPRKEDRQLVVKAVARPEPDVKLLAKAFIGMAIDLAEREQKEATRRAGGDQAEDTSRP